MPTSQQELFPNHGVDIVSIVQLIERIAPSFTSIAKGELATPYSHERPAAMQLTQLRRPVQAAALSTTGYRPLVLTSFTLPIRPATQQPSSLIPEKNGVEGRRYASVKSQGAYKMSNKKTIAKKLGAKRTGGMSYHATTRCCRRQRAYKTLGDGVIHTQIN